MFAGRSDASRSYTVTKRSTFSRREIFRRVSCLIFKAEGTPELIKDGAKAGVGAVFMKKASSMVGAPGMAASEMITPLFASYVATNETSKLVDNALENTNLTTTEKSTISSGPRRWNR